MYVRGRVMAQVVSRRPLIAPVSVHVEFVVDKVSLGQDFLRVRQLSPVYIISPWFSMLAYHLGINNRPVGGHSSETSSHPINMNKIFAHNSRRDLPICPRLIMHMH
jgi:hypothetical protein